MHLCVTKILSPADRQYAKGLFKCVPFGTQFGAKFFVLMVTPRPRRKATLLYTLLLHLICQSESVLGQALDHETTHSWRGAVIHQHIHVADDSRYFDIVT